MKSAVLFLQGRYEDTDCKAYRSLARGKFKVAVDGGYRFFEKSKLRPELLIGDLDSMGSLIRSVPKDVEVMDFPPDKDWTDSELALDYCLESGFGRIDIVQPSTGQVDHFLANVLLLSRSENGKADIRLHGPDYEIRVLTDRRMSLNAAQGKVLSVLPWAKSIRLTCRGTAFDVERVKISYGSTLGTRNKVIRVDAWVQIEGSALIVLR